MATDGEGSGGEHRANQRQSCLSDSNCGCPLAPSCYRVSQLSGAIEVTARLKCGDDLDLILKVLEAHRPHFAKMDQLANEVLTLSEAPAVTHQPSAPTPGNATHSTA